MRSDSASGRAQSNLQLAAIVGRLALAVALLVALVPPLGHATLRYEGLVEHLDLVAEIKADTITRGLIATNPDFWPYEALRLEELLSSAPALLDHESVSVRDAKGRLLMQVGRSPGPPVLRRSRELYDSDLAVGRVEIEHSLREIFFGTAVSAVLGLLLGTAVFAVLRILPLRALRRVTGVLEENALRLEDTLRARDREIAEREKAQDEMRKSEERYRNLFELSPEGMMIVSDGRIALVNKAFATMLGPGVPEDPSREPFLEIFHPTYRERLEAAMLEMWQERLPMPALETKLLAHGGATLDVEVSASPLAERGERRAHVVIRDISERMRARASLENANMSLQRLSARVLAIQEEERRRLSNELHDDLGQTLVALQIGLHRLAQRPMREDESRLLAECESIVRVLQGKVRDVSLRLLPPQLGELGLQDALRALVLRQRATTGLDIRCDLEGAEYKGEFSPQVEIACYRICQEALNNATRHSNARVVEVRTKQERERFWLSVRDDGAGFEPEAWPEDSSAGNNGLTSMRERARLAGGVFELRTAPGAGTVIIAMFPCKMAAAVDEQPLG